MENKLCFKCKNIKTIDFFRIIDVSANKYYSWCIECSKKYDHDRHQKQRPRIIELQKIRKKDIDKWYMELKASLKCSNCPEDHPACLTFHHINPEEKETEVDQAVASHWSKKRILKEIKKCIVLCSNCHNKHHFGYKWAEFIDK